MLNEPEAVYNFSNLDTSALKAFMRERAQMMWMIGHMNMPGLLLFNTMTEFTLYPPDTDEAGSFELLDIPWQRRRWFVTGAAIRHKIQIETFAKACRLDMFDGSPSAMGAGSDKVEKFPMDSPRCFTLANRFDARLMQLQPRVSIALEAREGDICELIYNGWRPSPAELRRQYENELEKLLGPERAS